MKTWKICCDSNFCPYAGPIVVKANGSVAKPCFHADVEAKHGLNKACDETICPTRQEQPLKSIAQWQREVHETAIIHGWWSAKRDIPELMALLHSEVSEAFEAYRDHNMELFREELADVAIRLLDTCEAFGINLEEEIARKAEINRTRPYRHGGQGLLMEFFLVSCDEDGDVAFKRYNQGDLERFLNEDYFGPLEFFGPGDAFEHDPTYWKKAVIIKGDIVLPKKVVVAKQYSLEE